MRTRRTAVAALFMLVGCATTSPPPELVKAQNEYARVSHGPAASAVPDEVRRARLALDAAEQSYAKDPRGTRTRDLAYVAERKAQLAEARARLANDQRAIAQADQNYKRGLATAQQRTQQQLQAAEARARSEEARAQSEEAARVDAERRADAATQDLARIAQLREEERGLVITISGDVLFATDQWTILSSARLKLDELAEALKETEQKLIVEGHTDARGSDTHNQDLSYKRAMAVRDYLAGRGVPAERLEVAGFGESRPIADNTSPEGRAQNRRVEIVVEGKVRASR